MAVTKDMTEGTAKRGPKAKAAGTGANEFDDLSNLAREGKACEDEIRAQTGGSMTWIACVQPGAGVLTKGDPAYMKGVEAGDFYIADKKLHTGDTLRATVLGMFKVYAEQKRKESENEMAQTISFWLPQDAEQILLPPGENFARTLANGNTLVPMHWVFLDIEGHPEITDAMLPFRSKGNAYFKNLEKLVKKSSEMCVQCIVEFRAEAVRSEEYKKTYFYPVGSVVGKNFEFDAETGKVELVKGGPNAAEVRRLLERYNDLQKSYKDLKIVSKRSQQMLEASIGAPMIGGPAPRRGLPGGSAKGGYAVDDASDESAKF